MSAATLEQEEAVTAEAMAIDPQAIWGDKKLEVIGGTGEFNSGKTVFGLLIDPGPRTICYDNEGSASSYLDIGFVHVDIGKELLEKFPNGATSRQRFEWWHEDVFKRVKKGNCTVICIDPVSELQDGIVDYVRAHPMQFGYSANQFNNSSALLWGATKAYLKSILDRLRVSGVQTVYYTAHMRDQFKGATPTGRREAKGVETFFEMASLYLEFRRPTSKDGKQPDVPSAIVLKQRLMRFNNGQTTPILPPNLEEATPNAIRAYIRKPADYAHLKKSERIEFQEMTPQQKLLLEAKIAEDRRAAEEAALTRETTQAEWAATANTPAAVSAAPVSQGEATPAAAPAANGSATTKLQTRTKGEIANTDPTREFCSNEQHARLTELWGLLGVSTDVRNQVLKSKDCQVIRNLRTEQAAELIAKAEAAFSKRQPEDTASAEMVAAIEEWLKVVEQRTPGEKAKVVAKMDAKGVTDFNQLCHGDAIDLLKAAAGGTLESFFGLSIWPGPLSGIPH